MMLAVLSLLEATLTLPGMAGILLTLGMAVDANILINERIREETKLDRKPVAALEAGFRRAYSTIIDSNATAFLAHVMLFVFGSPARCAGSPSRSPSASSPPCSPPPWSPGC